MSKEELVKIKHISYRDTVVNLPGLSPIRFDGEGNAEVSSAVAAYVSRLSGFLPESGIAEGSEAPPSDPLAEAVDSLTPELEKLTVAELRSKAASFDVDPAVVAKVRKVDLVKLVAVEMVKSETLKEKKA